MLEQSHEFSDVEQSHVVYDFEESHVVSYKKHYYVNSDVKESH